MTGNTGFKKIKLIGADGVKIFNRKQDISLYDIAYN